MRTETVRLGTARAQAGQKVWGHLRIAQGRKTSVLPVIVIHGARPGRHIVLMANQHGNEVNGVEALRRFCVEVNPRRVRGTIFVIPSANPHAAIRGTACWFEGKDDKGGSYRSKYNMNWIWPGRRGGLLIERAVHELWHQAILSPHAKASLVLDFHCASGAEASVAAEDGISQDLGVASGVRWINQGRSVAISRQKPIEVSPLYCACDKVGIPVLCIELAGQNKMTPSAIEAGVRIVRNVLKFAGCLPGRLELPRRAVIIDPWKEQFKGCVWLGRARKASQPRSYVYHKARKAGLFVPRKDPFEMVKKGDLVGEIIYPYSGRVVQQIRAGMSGAVHSVPQKAACAAGDSLVCVASARAVNPKAYLRRKSL